METMCVSIVNKADINLFFKNMHDYEKSSKGLTMVVLPQSQCYLTVPCTHV